MKHARIVYTHPSGERLSLGTLRADKPEAEQLEGMRRWLRRSWRRSARPECADAVAASVRVERRA